MIKLLLQLIVTEHLDECKITSIDFLLIIIRITCYKVSLKMLRLGLACMKCLFPFLCVEVTVLWLPVSSHEYLLLTLASGVVLFNWATCGEKWCENKVKLNRVVRWERNTVCVNKISWNRVEHVGALNRKKNRGIEGAIKRDQRTVGEMGSEKEHGGEGGGVQWKKKKEIYMSVKESWTEKDRQREKE